MGGFGELVEVESLSPDPENWVLEDEVITAGDDQDSLHGIQGEVSGLVELFVLSVAILEFLFILVEEAEDEGGGDDSDAAVNLGEMKVDIREDYLDLESLLSFEDLKSEY